jgi:hypothetical protein
MQAMVGGIRGRVVGLDIGTKPETLKKDMDGPKKVGLPWSGSPAMNLSMPRIPLEDNFTDVIGKAQRGYKLSDAALAAKAGITEEDLAAVKGGDVRVPTLIGLAEALELGREALLAHARREWYPEQPIFKRGFAMFNTAFEDMTVNSYLVWDSKTRQRPAHARHPGRGKPDPALHLPDPHP